MVGVVDLNVGGIAKAIFDGVDSLFTSDEERAKAKLAIEQALQKPHILQAMTNLEAAKHDNWFVAGARPALLWVCVIGMFYALLIHPVLNAVGHFWGIPMLPELDTQVLMTMTLAMLGLGGMRTFEKMRGVARSPGTPAPSTKPGGYQHPFEENGVY